MALAKIIQISNQVVPLHFGPGFLETMDSMCLESGNNRMIRGEVFTLATFLSHQDPLNFYFSFQFPLSFQIDPANTEFQIYEQFPMEIKLYFTFSTIFARCVRLRQGDKTVASTI